MRTKLVPRGNEVKLAVVVRAVPPLAVEAALTSPSGAATMSSAMAHLLCGYLVAFVVLVLDDTLCSAYRGPEAQSEY